MSSSDLKLSVGVRDFVAPLQKSGSIEHELSGMSKRLGQEWHIKIQNEHLMSGIPYHKERFVQGTIQTSLGDVTLSGRVDGFFEQIGVVEEIKTSTNLSKLENDLQNEDHPYWKQVMVYAFLLDLEGVPFEAVRLRLVHVQSGQQKTLDLKYHPEAVSIWVNQRAEDLLSKEKKAREAWSERKEMASKMVFPFSTFRAGQQEIISTVKDLAINTGFALHQAPTGLGKTMAHLWPALQVGLIQNRPVIYLTAKSKQQTAVKEGLQSLTQKGAKIRAIFMNARARACLNEELICHKDYCKYALHHFDKCQQQDLYVFNEKPHTAQSMRELGTNHEICPFQFSFDLLPKADLVVADYNYVFSPGAGFLEWLEGAPNKPIVLVDEAHNLHHRVLDHWRWQWSEAEYDYMEAFCNMQGRLATALKRIQRQFSDQLQQFTEQWREGLDGAPNWLEPLERQTAQTLIQYLENKKGQTEKDPVLSWYRWIQRAFRILNNWGPEQAVLGGEDPVLLTRNPARFLKQVWGYCHAAIVFSATLKPFDFYRNILGMPKGTLAREWDNPFPEPNRKLFLIPQVSSKLKNRSRSIPKICDLVKRVVAIRPGNYAVFFPSYHFLQATIQFLSQQKIDFELLEQKPNQNQEEHIHIWQSLSGKENQVLFAVQGGVYGEGVDFKGATLTGAILVGPGLPSFTQERKLHQRYLQDHFGQGWSYCTTFPAMAKTIQAAGRVIRGEQERGLLIFLDDRFLEPSFMQCFPKNWLENHPKNWIPKSLLKEIQEWEKAD